MADFQGDDDAELVISHHPLAIETTTGNGTIYDGAAASTAGAAGYVMVTDFTGTNIAIKIQHSSAADFGSDVADLITFTSVTAAAAYQRVAATGTVKRYTRLVISGTFTSARLVVAFARL